MCSYRCRQIPPISKLGPGTILSAQQPFPYRAFMSSAVSVDILFPSSIASFTKRSPIGFTAVCLAVSALRNRSADQLRRFDIAIELKRIVLCF